MQEETVIERLLDYAEPVDCRKGKVLIDKGNRPDLLYYIQRGTVEVSNTVDDTKIVIAIIGAGNFFGEIGFFDRQPRTCNVTATEDSDIFVFSEDSIRSIRNADAALYGDFLSVITRIISTRFRGF